MLKYSIKDKKALNPCYKCGTERVFLKTWKEDLVTFTGKIEEVTFFQTVCPNKDCQKVVDSEIKLEEEKREANRMQRKENNTARKEYFLSKAKKNNKE